MQQAHKPFQTHIRRVTGRRRLQKMRREAIQASAPACRQRARACTGGQRLQGIVRILCIAKTQLRKQFGLRFTARQALPIHPRRIRIRGRRGFFRTEAIGKFRGDFAAHTGQFQRQRVPIRKSQCSGHARAREIVFRHVMGLLVAQHLHAVFEATQKPIGIAQSLRAGQRHGAQAFAGGERWQQARIA